MSTLAKKKYEIGEKLTLRIEKVAHGGHFVARHEGAVFFVRHAISGELVTATITGVEKNFYKADAIDVLEVSPDRIEATCAYAKPGMCGGCDFAHIAIERQRTLKSEVIREQFSRLARQELEVSVEEVSGISQWRTRFSASTDDAGTLGFKKNASSETIPIAHCPVLIQDIDFPTIDSSTLGSNKRCDVTIGTDGRRTITIAAERQNRQSKREEQVIVEGQKILTYEVLGKKFSVSHRSFWQSNVNAPKVLVQAVLDISHFQSGEHVLDLYGGVGLFTRFIADAVGPGGRVDLFEASTTAVADAAKNFENESHIKIHQGDVARQISSIKRADVVLLDPPRTGAGKEVIAKITSLSARAIVYVACDPAALARDTEYLREHGYFLQEIRAFDLFPQTHHMECIALYLPDKVS
jgi:tRNA/tmRNA/rRNA uracil-C5-methylase (TrmA/RlmC/RlmD family)